MVGVETKRNPADEFGALGSEALAASHILVLLLDVSAPDR